MTDSTEASQQEPEEEKSFLRVIVHSFFIIPFLIAVFCLVLFAGIKLLTQEKRSVYDYLEDVKTGGKNKRWQGALELSKILSNPDQVPGTERFINEMISAFEHAEHDDNKVRQYLALAMGRTANSEFAPILVEGLKEEKEANLPALIYGLGMIGLDDYAQYLHEYVEHSNPRIRSITMVSLGNIGNSASISFLKKGLKDSEPNVQWGAAISLAQMKDLSGKDILLKLLDRQYLGQFQEVDQSEANNLVLAAIAASGPFKDKDLDEKLKTLSTEDTNMKVRAAALAQIDK